MSDLFDLLTEYRNWAVADRHSKSGGLFEQPGPGLGDFWRPYSGWHEPWLTDPTWPSSIRTAQHRVILLQKSADRWSWMNQREEPHMRSGCTACGWLSDERWSVMQSLTEGLDHSHPGWWSTPVVNSLKQGASIDEAFEWGCQVARVYPDGWFETGGPVRTYRSGYDTDPKPGKAPGGGWDVPGLVVPKPERAEPVKMLSVAASGYGWYGSDLVLDIESGEIVPEWQIGRSPSYEWDDSDEESDDD